MFISVDHASISWVLFNKVTLYLSQSSFHNGAHFSWSCQHFMSSFLQSSEDVIGNFGNQLFGPCIAQRSHIVYVFCKSVSSFSQNLNIRFFHFFCMLLRIYNLQKLMQLKFGGQFIHRLKGTKNKVFEQFCHDYFGD